MEEKVKGGHKANDAQKEKIAAKSKLKTELEEHNSQAGLYLEGKRKLAKEQKKELDEARRQAVKTVVQVTCLSTIL